MSQSHEIRTLDVSRHPTLGYSRRLLWIDGKIRSVEQRDCPYGTQSRQTILYDSLDSYFRAADMGTLRWSAWA